MSEMGSGRDKKKVIKALPVIDPLVEERSLRRNDLA